MTMLAMGGVLIFGLIICIFLAPETRGLNLAEASGSAAIGTEEKVMEKLEEEHNQLEEIIVRKDID